MKHRVQRHQAISMIVILLFLTATFSGTYAQSDRQPSSAVCPDEQPEKNPDTDLTLDEFEQRVRNFSAVGGHLGLTQSLFMPNTTRLGASTWRIDEPEKPFTVLWAILYNEQPSRGTDPVPTRIAALLNEQPLPLNENGDLFLDMTFVSGSFEIIPFTLPILQPGIYDFSLFAVPNSRLHPEVGPEGFVNEMDRSHEGRSFRRRLTLVVDGQAAASLVPEQREYKMLPVFQEWPATSFSGPGMPIPSLSNEPIWWAYPDGALRVRAGQDFTFNLLDRYRYLNILSDEFEDGERFAFAYRIFMDYQPVDIEDGQSVYYAEVPRKAGRVILNFTLTAPETPGNYDLVIVQIAYPGLPLCRFGDDFDIELDSFQVIPLTITVEE